MDLPLVGREREVAQACSVLEPDGPPVVVVRGAGGIGKSRLLDEVVALAEGWSVVRVFGAPTVARVPFGAVSHLLDLEGLPAEPTTLFAHVRQAIVGGAFSSRLLVVDDVHAVDEFTAEVVNQLVAHEEARIVVAVRDPPGPPAPLASVLVDPDTVPVDLEPLNHNQTRQLVEHVLGSPVDDDVADRVWEHTDGLPLFAVVLVKAAAAAGVLYRSDGTFRARDELPLVSLHELVRTRTSVLDGSAQKALEAAAVGGRLPIGVFDALAGRHALESAVGHGFLTIGSDERIDFAHPVYGEATLEAMGEARRKEMAGALLDATENVARIDRIRRAILMLDAGRPLPADEAVAAAMEALARLDHRMGETLARVALEAAPTSVLAHLVLARALTIQARGPEAEEILRATRPTTDEEVADVIVARAYVQAFLLGKPGEAIGLLREQADLLPDSLRTALDADRALYGAMLGSFTEAIEAGERVLSSKTASGMSRLRAITNTTLALTMTGRLEGIDSLLDEARRLASEYDPHRPLVRLQIELTALDMLFVSGRIAEALARAERWSEDRTVGHHPVWVEWAGLMQDAMGRYEEAIRLQRKAIAGYAETDPFRLRPQAVGMLGMHHGQLGHVPPDLRSLMEEAEAEAAGETRLTLWTGRGRAWMAAVEASPDQAARIARKVGSQAADRDHLVWAGLAFHDAVRFGRPELVRRDLEELIAPMSGVHVVEVMAAHAVALEDEDGDALAAVADRFATLGAVPLAVEAWAQSAVLHANRDLHAASRRAATRAKMLSQNMGEMKTPAGVQMPEAITDREFEVTLAALSGRTSREIADLFFVSVRTVENQLAAVYRKLEVSGREELASVLRSTNEESAPHR